MRAAQGGQREVRERRGSRRERSVEGPQEAIEAPPTPTAHGHPGAVTENDFVAADSPQGFADAIETDDGPAVHAREDMRVEPRFERRERLARQMSSAGDVDTGVVVLGPDPVDLLCPDDKVTRGGPNHEMAGAGVRA